MWSFADSCCASAPGAPLCLQKRFMSRLTPDKKLNLFAHRWGGVLQQPCSRAPAACWFSSLLAHITLWCIPSTSSCSEPAVCPQSSGGLEGTCAVHVPRVSCCCRVAKRAAEVAAEEAVPWAARDPSTQACALMYGVMQIHKVC